MNLTETHGILTRSKEAKSLPILENVYMNGKAISTDLNSYLITENPGLAEGLYLVKGKNFYKSTSEIKDFPSIPEKEFTFLFEADMNFLTALKEAFNFVSTEDMRPAMQGVLLDLDNSKIVSTDGHRLFTQELNFSGTGQYLINPASVKFFVRIAKKEKSFKVSAAKNYLKIDTASFSLICRLLEDKFPNYESVIPLDNWVQFTYNRKELLNKVELCYEILDRAYFKIEFRPYQLSITAENIADNLNRTEKIKPIRIKQIKKKINDLENFGFNCKYLITVLNGFKSDFISFTYNRSSSAMMFSGDLGKTILLMPVRL